MERHQIKGWFFQQMEPQMFESGWESCKQKIFTDDNIVRQTEKAYLVNLMYTNGKIAQTWIPKSATMMPEKDYYEQEWKARK